MGLANFVPLQYEKVKGDAAAEDAPNPITKSINPKPFIILIFYSYNYERKQKVQHLEDHHPVHHHRTHRRRKLLPHPELHRVAMKKEIGNNEK